MFNETEIPTRILIEKPSIVKPRPCKPHGPHIQLLHTKFGPPKSKIFESHYDNDCIFIHKKGTIKLIIAFRYMMFIEWSIHDRTRYQKTHPFIIHEYRFTI